MHINECSQQKYTGQSLCTYMDGGVSNTCMRMHIDIGTHTHKTCPFSKSLVTNNSTAQLLTTDLYVMGPPCFH